VPTPKRGSRGGGTPRQALPNTYLRSRQLLNPGARVTTPDPTIAIRGLDQLLAVWEANRAHRLKAKAPAPPVSELLRGLFGGGS
jgi:hypothetical protein